MPKTLLVTSYTNSNPNPDADPAPTRMTYGLCLEYQAFFSPERNGRPRKSYDKIECLRKYVYKNLQGQVLQGTGNLCRVLDLLQNLRVICVGYRMCYSTHRSVGYCIQISQANLCGVPDLTESTEVQGIMVQLLSQNSQKYRVLWNYGHRTHRSTG